jgi:hypothetical protein
MQQRASFVTRPSSTFDRIAAPVRSILFGRVAGKIGLNETRLRMYGGCRSRARENRINASRDAEVSDTNFV